MLVSKEVIQPYPPCMVYRNSVNSYTHLHARSHTKAHSVVENYKSNTLDYVNGGYFCGLLQPRASEKENNSETGRASKKGRYERGHSEEGKRWMGRYTER